MWSSSFAIYDCCAYIEFYQRSSDALALDLVGSYCHAIGGGRTCTRKEPAAETYCWQQRFEATPQLQKQYTDIIPPVDSIRSARALSTLMRHELSAWYMYLVCTFFLKVHINKLLKIAGSKFPHYEVELEVNVLAQKCTYEDK